MFMQDDLTTKAQGILRDAYKVADVSIIWVRPQDKAHGDLATPIALQVAKLVSKPPLEIAKAIVKDLQGLEGVKRAEVAGAGYVNIWLTPAVLLNALEDVPAACSPTATRKDEAPVIVEYSQPNIAKPLGAHHLMTTLIGQSIANLYQHLGYPVIKWNYIGDWGTQFGKLAVAHERWGTKETAKDYSIDELLELYVRFHNEAESDPSLEDEGRTAFKKLEKGDDELRQFWMDVVSVTKKALESLYERMHVSFDLDLGESFYEDKMDKILTDGKSKGVFAEGENGALIVSFADDKYPPYLVQKSDGATLYSTRDIAQMRYRIDTYHPQSINIVTDVAQKLHFEQLVETCRLLDWELPEFENVLTGRMQFIDKSMSTRKGNILNLKQVLDEAVARARKVIDEHGEEVQTDDPDALAEMMGTGAVAYGILSQNRKQNIVFDWDTALSFDGNSAPYLQYTHARAQSVLRKSGVEKIEIPKNVTELTERERILVGELCTFPTTLEKARDERMPHVLTNYLFSLCQEYNTFYNAEPILKADEPQRSLRLALTSLTASVLKAGAEILTIRVPDRM